jgi:hypothetical protein
MGAKEVIHGTTQGYQAHKRRGEDACTPCLVAWRVYYRRRAASKRQERVARKYKEATGDSVG